MAATDARPIPQRGVAYRVTFPILDADGDLVTGATGLDSERSLDGATFADCTNEATEIATASGMYFLDLTAAEMTADTVAVIVKTSSSGAKTTPIVLYPVEDGDIPVKVTQFPDFIQHAGTATAGAVGSITLAAGASATNAFYQGAMIFLASGAGAGQARLCTAYTGATRLATIQPNWTAGNNPASGTRYVILPLSQVDIGRWLALAPNALVAGRVDTRPGALATGVITSGAYATDAITSGAVAASAAIEIGQAARDQILSDATPFAGADIDAAISSRATPAQVNTQVVDALTVDTYGEPPKEAPPVTASLQAKLGYLFKFMRNRITNDGSTLRVYNEDETTVDHQTAVSEAGGVVERSEFGIGA
jgi:hypothetical protein